MFPKLVILRSNLQMSLASGGSGGSAPDLLAKIPASAPTLNSVQRNQIHLYPKIVGGYRALVNV